MSRFDPTAITTSRILSGDVTPERMRLNTQSANLKKAMKIKTLAAPSGQGGIRQTSARGQR
jgi:hypothetical protein